MHRVAESKPVSRVSLADQVYDRLLSEIQLGQLRSGDQLSEVSIAERYAVSRTPVREALRRLSSDQLVRSAGNRLSTVVRLSRRETIDAYRVRRCLEEYAARLAAKRISDEEIRTLRELCQQASPGKLREWVEAEWSFDMRLHQVVARASGNELLSRDIQRYLNMVRLVRGISAQNEARLIAGHDEHERILDALAAHDADGVAQLMAQHIDSSLDAVLRDVDWQEKETMIDIGSFRARTCQGVGRRSFLKVGATLPFLPASARATEMRKPRAKSVLFVFLWGAPSHLDTFDPKPDAPLEYRGPFSPIPTKTPGVHFTELLPRLANRSDLFTLVRSHVTSAPGHPDAGTVALTGFPEAPTPIQPNFGAIVAKHRAGSNGSLPPFFSIANGTVMDGVRRIEGYGRRDAWGQLRSVHDRLLRVGKSQYSVIETVGRLESGQDHRSPTASAAARPSIATCRCAAGHRLEPHSPQSLRTADGSIGAIRFRFDPGIAENARPIRPLGIRAKRAIGPATGRSRCPPTSNSTTAGTSRRSIQDLSLVGIRIFTTSSCCRTSIVPFLTALFPLCWTTSTNVDSTRTHWLSVWASLVARQRSPPGPPAIIGHNVISRFGPAQVLNRGASLERATSLVSTPHPNRFRP